MEKRQSMPKSGKVKIGKPQGATIIEFMDNYNLFFTIRVNFGICQDSSIVAIGLKSSFDVKLENLKSDLNYLKSKENFKFTKPHKRGLKFHKRHLSI
jgi:hypothetical protein